MKQYLLKIIENSYLTREDTYSIMIGITQEKFHEQQIAALLMALQARGISVDELLGFRDALLETGKRVKFTDNYNTLDIVGTGGDGKNTFNISTCSAFVIAGAGFKVTKHGNAGSTSVSGASNVLSNHGIKFTTDEAILQKSLDEANICYLHAPLFAYGMKFVGPTRKALAVPTCFNLLGPLVNPCHPKNSLHGTAKLEQLRLYTNVHQRIGDNFGVVTSYDGYDEISLTGDFKLTTPYFEKIFKPEDMGFKKIKPEEIYGGKTEFEAMKIFDNVLECKSTEAQKNVILANAACGICVMDKNIDYHDAVEMAKKSLESKKALAMLKKFIDINS